MADQPRRRWEYLTVMMIHLTEDDLDSYGADGWEAVCAMPNWHRGDAAMLFKRPLAPTTEAVR